MHALRSVLEMNLYIVNSNYTRINTHCRIQLFIKTYPHSVHISTTVTIAVTAIITNRSSDTYDMMRAEQKKTHHNNYQLILIDCTTPFHSRSPPPGSSHRHTHTHALGSFFSYELMSQPTSCRV